ncbi:MAG: phenylalanine 4-monooxygenase [Alphaproteobacteria bacterium]|nr:phenylalanine 4-monooxygenase [Alphaproteobacteria bacterium]
MPGLEHYARTHPAIRADFTIDQGWDNYPAEAHDTWRRLYARMETILPGRAAPAFLEGLKRLDIGHEKIPHFERLSDGLEALTGWRIVAVPGLVPDEKFFDHLANRRFPASNFIRRPEQLDYIEEPDIFHDIFGHVPMLAHPVFADYMQAYGQGGLRAEGLGVLPNLARLYWYTVEFGLIAHEGRLEFYGSGIASSSAESVYCLASPSPNRIAFDLERVMRTRYRIDDLQETYLVIDSFESLFAATYQDFAALYERLRTGPTYEPGTVLAQDRVHWRGDRSYKPHSHAV